MKKIAYDGYNDKIGNSEIIGTIVPQNSRWGMTNGWKIIEVDELKELFVIERVGDRDKICWSVRKKEAFTICANAQSKTQLVLEVYED